MRTKLLTTALGALTAAAIFTLPGYAEAYNLNSARAGTTTTLNLYPWVQILLPNHYTALQNAAAKINANRSDMRFLLVNDNDLIVASNNGESEVTFATGAALLCSSIACTLNWKSGGLIDESDVYFDSSYTWITTDAKADSVAYGGSTRPVLNTALHEFAHTMGLGHEADVFNVLGNAWNVVNTNGDSTESVISEDTNNGLVAHYGQRASVTQDLSIYHWEWSGSTNGYSNHARVPIEDTLGVELSAAPESNPSLNEPAYYANSGQTIALTQTAENRGTFQSVTVKWFLSTNSTISTSDTLLASSTLNKGNSDPFTWTRNVNLPGGLVPGTRYWVGVIIDSQDVVAEQNESNNAAYLAEIVIQ